jgi:hypothetical protein
LHLFDFSLENANVFANFRLKNQEFAPKNVSALYLIVKNNYFFDLFMVGNDDW